VFDHFKFFDGRFTFSRRYEVVQDQKTIPIYIRNFLTKFCFLKNFRRFKKHAKLNYIHCPRKNGYFCRFGAPVMGEK